MLTLTVRKIGDFTRLRASTRRSCTVGVSEGDTLFLTESPLGFHLTPHDPGFEEQMTFARRIMQERRNALRRLAEE